MGAQTLLFLDFLADRQLVPGAVVFGFGDGDPERLPASLADAGCAALLGEFPSYIRPDEASRLPPGAVAALRGAGVQLLPADAVYTPADSDTLTLPARAKWVGGNWYLAPPAKPAGSHATSHATSQATSRALALELLRVVAADADIRDVEDIFRHDPGLSYHLLRIVNSVGMGANRKISSLSQAILVLGRQQLKRWLSLMLFAAGKEDRRSAMLLARAAVRAHGMERLARAAGLDKAWQELAFMGGMFSLLGTLFGRPLREVLAPLQLSDPLADALLHQENDLGRLLHALGLAESGDATGLRVALDDLGIALAEFNATTAESHLWALRFAGGGQDSRDV
ncbi:MAG: HDOD domain-containing protein [Betaproteobacteria bacterium]|nr:HDOD domain-containing protein [Betaproteobacteria bacterium]